MHKKRKTIPSFWNINKTGTKYVSIPNHEQNNSMPLITIMREMLGIVKNKKELKTLLHEKKISINGKIINEIGYPLMFFDSLSLPSIKKNYRIWMAGKKFKIIEIKEDEAKFRVYKIIGKKMLPKKKIQINLDCGRNIISNEKMDTGDFLQIDNEKNNIMKILKLDKNAEVIVLKGKHTGKIGKIKEIRKEGEEKIAVIKTSEGEINSNIKNIYLTG